MRWRTIAQAAAIPAIVAAADAAAAAVIVVGPSNADDFTRIPAEDHRTFPFPIF